MSEIDVLSQQLSLGGKNVSQDTLSKVIAIISLLENLMQNSHEAIVALEQEVTR